MKIENKDAHSTLSAIFNYIEKASNQGICGSVDFFINAGEQVNDWTFKILYQGNFNIRTFHSKSKLLDLSEDWSIGALQKILVKILECKIINIHISKEFQQHYRLYECDTCYEIYKKQEAQREKEALEYSLTHCEACGRPFEDEED